MYTMFEHMSTIIIIHILPLKIKKRRFSLYTYGYLNLIIKCPHLKIYIIIEYLQI